jgi:DNA-binding beta-propeller fold protein YncE
MSTIARSASWALAALLLAACSGGSGPAPDSALPQPAGHGVATTHNGCHGCLYAADYAGQTVKIYRPGENTPVETITDVPNPVAVALDPPGILAVASAKGPRRRATIRLYLGDETYPYHEIDLGNEQPAAIAFETYGNELYVDQFGGLISVYAIPSGKEIRKFELGRGGSIRGIAFASDGDFAIGLPDEFLLFRAEKTHPYAVVKAADADGVVYDRKNILAVAERNRNEVAIFAFGHTRPSEIITDGIERPRPLAVDHSNDLYVGNDHSTGPDTITVYDEKGNVPIRTIKKGVRLPKTLAISGDTLYVLNAGGVVTEYKRDGTPLQTLDGPFRSIASTP